MKLLMKMRQIKDLSPSERHVVDYILDNTHEITNIGIVELAKKTNTSTSTLKRLCKKLDIDSYIDFRLQLSMELAEYLQSNIMQRGMEPVGRYDSIGDIVEKVSNTNAKSIIDSSNLLDAELVGRVIDMMTNARQIDFYGMGPSNLVAMDAQLKCMRLGINATAYGDYVEMYMNERTSDAKHLAFMISYTGETAEILAIARDLVSRSIPVVSITGLSDNTLCKLCPINIFVDATESQNRLGGMSSRISTLNVIDILFTALINSDYDKYTAVSEMTKAHMRALSK